MPEQKQCRHEWESLVNGLGWLCTLPEGHIGYHVAHDLDGSICATTEDHS